jgi:simple sugar transport system permease protein
MPSVVPVARPGAPQPKARRLPALLWPVLALALLLAFNGLFTAGFFQIQVRDGHLYGSLIDLLNRAAPIMLCALGMTLVIATAGVDLSVGAVMAIAGSVAAYLLLQSKHPLPLYPALAVALAACLLAGLWNGFLVAVCGVQPIVATLVLMVAGRGIAQLITGGQIPLFDTAAPAFGFIGRGHFALLPFSITIVAIVFAFAALLTRRTALGLFIESVGDSESASRYAGVSARLVKMCAYGSCGLCAGVAGLIGASNIMGADANNAGRYMELDAILAAVIGGTALTGGRFSLIGAVVGALVIQALNLTIVRSNVQPEYNQVVKAVVVLILCLLQSERLRGLLWRARP